MKEKQVQDINPAYVVSRKPMRSPAYYREGILKGDRYVLSQCITLLESRVMSRRQLALDLLAHLPVAEHTIRIGITGSPGVGKSTFIEAFGCYLVEQGHRPAVLAIDPSSSRNKGSILGDKTRMARLSASSDAFVRPSPSSSSLGGTAEMTHEAVQLCEAAGYTILLIETVGVGQSETEVSQLTDVNILLLQPGAGDDIQGIKRGIMEMADLFVINKADGRQKELAVQSCRSYATAVPYFMHDIPGWQCPVLLASSMNGEGISDVSDSVTAFIALSKKTGFFRTKRRQQLNYWFEKQAVRAIQDVIFQDQRVRETYLSLQKELEGGNKTLYGAVEEFKAVLR